MSQPENPFGGPADRFDFAAEAQAAVSAAAQPLAVARPDLFANQWYVKNTGAFGGGARIDVNLRDVWEDYAGRDVSVGIWDDGIDYRHWDLAGAYDASRHVTVGGRSHDPLPSSADSMHGTAVAGIIAAARNGAGVTGIAYGARITGVDILSDGGVSPEGTFRFIRRFDVTNHSWGPTLAFGYDFLETAWTEYLDGLYDSSVLGRGGLGTINVMAAGNDRETGRHTNDSGLTSLSHTIAVAAVGYDGRISYYSTPGAGLLVSAPSSDEGDDPAVWTTDRRGAAGYSPGRDEGENDAADVTAAFGGTSAAAPMVAAVAALMLEANPGLGWRDVQEILAYSARHVGTAVGSGARGDEIYDWTFNGARTWNGGGLHHSGDYGFGLVDAHAAVRLAETWSLVQTDANRFADYVAEWTGIERIEDDIDVPLILEFTVAQSYDLESVAIELEFFYGEVSDYWVLLTSPSGTESWLAQPVEEAASKDRWFFLSKAFWGEDPVGTWELAIYDGIADFATGALSGAWLWFGGGVATRDDVYVFTHEFSDYAGRFGHSRRIADADGGVDALNAAAVRSASAIDLGDGSGRIDGVDVRFAGRFEKVYTGDGADRILGAGYGETLAGGRGADRIAGAGGADRIFGEAGDDRLTGGAGDDRLYGGAGGDEIHGGAGDDRIVDGSGADMLYGGSGRDVFVFARDRARDGVGDFQDRVDRIELAGVAYGDIARGTLEPGRVRLRWDDEVVILEDGGAGRLTAARITAADFDFV